MELLATLSDPIRTLLKRYSFKEIEEFYNPNMMFDAVHLLSLFDSESYENEELGSLVIHPLESKYPVRKAKNRFLTAARMLRNISRGIMKGIKIVEGHNIDIIRNKNVHEIGLMGTLISKETQKPLVQSIHGDFDTELLLTKNFFVYYYKHLLEIYNMKNATKVIGISRYLVEYAKRHGAKSVSYIPNPVDISPFLEKQSRHVLAQTKEKLGIAGKRVLLNVSRYSSKEKNVKRLLIAFSKLPEKLRKDWVLLIVGDGGGMEVEYRNFVAKLKIDNDVRFAGVIPHRRIPIFYQLADIFVFPSLTEGCPFALIEALPAGLPILTSTHPVPMEYVDETNGVIVNPYDIGEIRKGIEFLMGLSEKERANMENASRRKAMEYDRKIAFEKEANLYSTLVRR